MKKLISLLLCILLLTGCAETYDGPTESTAVLSKILTTYYDPTGGDSQYGRTDYAYDIYGNQVMELEYAIRSHDGEAEPHLKTLRSFDEHGNITRQRQYDVSGLIPKKLVDIRYEYDEKGRMTAHLDQMQEQYSWTAVYDDEARTMTCTYPHAVSVSYFDEHGNTIRQETVFENGDTSGIIFEFDANGNRISARYEETVGTTLHAYTYDDQGRVLTMTETTDGGTELLFRYEYRDDCTIQHNPDGTRIVTTYNDDGSEHYRYYTDSTDHITKDSMCYYTEIQVPIEEVSP